VKPPLVLASASPRRRDILEAAGVAFWVRPAAIDEITEGTPAEVAVENARAKALAVARPGELVLGVDTVVALDGRLWDKPTSAAVAASTLRVLSGRTHEVVSGFALVRDDAVTTGHELTRVTFRDLDDAAIDRYVESDEWHDRAGGYAIQGVAAILVARVEGDYLNVVGLPVAALDAVAAALRGT
jgi:septum formation protein